MTCGNCARHVAEAIQSVPGVRSAAVDLAAHQASVRWAVNSTPNITAIIQAVDGAGYGAKVIEADTLASGKRTLAGWQLNLWVGLFGTAPLMLGEWLLGLGTDSWFRWLSFALATVVQVVAGAPFYRGAWRQLRAHSSNMDTLVALGSTTAFAYSAWALLSGAGGHLYFMEAAAIITLISTGHWLESRMSARASSTLRQLLDLAPALARKRNPDGVESEAPVAELMIGDLVALRPGERVPTDGQVVDGDAAVDESMLTGESAPVDKSSGSPLYAGTVNLNGRLLMRVTATGEGTALAHIIAAVQRAQTSRANIQRLGDRVSNVFVPIVIALALAAGLFWGLAPDAAHRVTAWLSPYLWPAHLPASPLAAACIIAAAVLIVACPCAMGLATPAAIMAASNAAAQRGILIRDGVALEKAGRVTAVLFDKTGTLTVGKPEVVEVWEAPPPGVEIRMLPQGGTENRRNAEQIKPENENAEATPTLGLEALVAPIHCGTPPLGGSPPAASGSDEIGAPVSRLAASLARHSAHPISQAVARLSAEVSDFADWKEIPGAGLIAKIQTAASAKAEGSAARLGSLRWLSESGVDLTPGNGFIEEWSSQGATIVGVALDQSLCGLFAVKDNLKPGAREVLAQLRRQGLKTFLITGDNALTAASIAKQAGISPENVFAEVLPEQKAAFVQRLQQQHQRVAFVGDGINDAPALEQADLGIAVSRASDIAREAADIILLKAELEAVPESLGLARAALRTIKQNLFWAFFYNALAVPLAALGFMSPILCAAAMGLSDVVVIGNALRLRKWKM